jgi:hypothetical protein
VVSPRPRPHVEIFELLGGHPQIFGSKVVRSRASYRGMQKSGHNPDFLAAHTPILRALGLLLSFFSVAQARNQHRRSWKVVLLRLLRKY